MFFGIHQLKGGTNIRGMIQSTHTHTHPKHTQMQPRIEAENTHLTIDYNLLE